MRDLERRLALGRTVGGAYARVTGAEVVMIGGSVSRGHADRWSDVEIGVFWSGIPPERVRASLAKNAGLRNWRSFDGMTSVGGIEEEADAEGIKVDLVHMDTLAAEHVLHEVVDRADAALDKQSLVAAIRDGVPVHGEAMLRRWRDRTAPYPQALRLTMVKDHLVFGPQTWLEMLADRRDLLPLHELLSRIETAILGILLGVNGIYAPSVAPKWTRHLIERFEIAPDDLLGRFERMLTSDATTAIRLADRLIDETLTLVERRVPEIDTTRVRSRIAQTPRSPHEGM